MPSVRVSVSAFYDGQTTPAGGVVVCDADFAKRTVLFGHGELLVDDAPVDFETACGRLRATDDEIAATAPIRAAALAEREG